MALRMIDHPHCTNDHPHPTMDRCQRKVHKSDGQVEDSKRAWVTEGKCKKNSMSPSQVRQSIRWLAEDHGKMRCRGWLVLGRSSQAEKMLR
jgi:hypothetical protein